MAGPVSAFFFMYYMQELYSISSFDLAENAKNSRIPLPISFVSPFQGLDARTALWYTIVADNRMVPEELDLGFPARSDGRSSEAAADLRHSGCRLACSCRRPPSFASQIPRRAAGPVSAFFLCILYRNYIQL